MEYRLLNESHLYEGGVWEVDFTRTHDLVKDELREVEMSFRSIGKEIDVVGAQDVFNYFFKLSGKYLRPILVLLSGKTVNPQLNTEQKKQLIHLSVAVELIHSASLIHDDIIDGDLFRRGQKTLDNIYGRKIAVLAGDTLYAKAFSILAAYIPREAEQVITQVIEKMCLAEIDQAKTAEVSQQRYFGMIKGKTAVLMSACCKLGAMLAGADKNDIYAMESFGINFGMVYQIIDDCMDKDQNAGYMATTSSAQEFAGKAEKALEAIEASEYKQCLISLLNYVFKYSEAGK